MDTTEAAKIGVNIEIGCSGYSYADWKGQFYPADLKQNEMLSYYARRFRTVEINFSYYRMPTANQFSLMSERTPADFSFWVKGYQDFTHQQNMDGLGAFRDSLVPLVEAGKLAGVLFQFPQSFHYKAGNRQYLARLTEAMGGTRLAVEFRHRSWVSASVDEGLRDRNMSLVMVDVPKIEALYPPIYKATNGTGYLRLHSRSAANWYGGGEARYDYHYSDQELQEVVDGIQGLLDRVETLYVFFNNCKRGQAAENAERLRQLLNIPERTVAEIPSPGQDWLWPS